MLGTFGNNGELFFEIELVTVTGEKFLVDTLLYKIRLNNCHCDDRKQSPKHLTTIAILNRL